MDTWCIRWALLYLHPFFTGSRLGSSLKKSKPSDAPVETPELFLIDKLLKFMTKSIATLPLSLNEYLESFIFIFVGLSLCKQYQISVSSQTLHLITIFVTSQLIEMLFWQNKFVFKYKVQQTFFSSGNEVSGINSWAVSSVLSVWIRMT